VLSFRLIAPLCQSHAPFRAHGFGLDYKNIFSSTSNICLKKSLPMIGKVGEAILLTAEGRGSAKDHPPSARLAKKRKRKACPVVNAKRYTSGDDFKFFSSLHELLKFYQILALVTHSLFLLP